MCRLYAMRANEPTRVECSLVHAQNALMQQSQGDAVATAGFFRYYAGLADKIEGRKTAVSEMETMKGRVRAHG